MKKQLLALAMLTIASFSTQKLQAYCIYNDTGNNIRAIVFFSEDVAKLAKKFYDAIRWGQDNIAKAAAGEAGPAGTVALETGKKFGFLQDVGFKIGSIADQKISPYNMATKTSGKACYNYAEIAKEIAKRALTTKKIDPNWARENLMLYVLLMDADTGAIIPMTANDIFFPMPAGGWLSLRIDAAGKLVYQLGRVEGGKEKVMKNTGEYLGSYPGDTGQVRKIKTIQVK